MKAGQVPGELCRTTSSHARIVTGGQGVAGSNPAVPTRRSRSEGLRVPTLEPLLIFGSHHGSHPVYAVSGARLNISSMAAAPLVSADRISCQYTVLVTLVETCPTSWLMSSNGTSLALRMD